MPFGSDVVARFFFAAISMSSSRVVPADIAAPVVGGAVPSGAVPIAMTDMGLGGSFVMRVIFVPTLLGLAGVGG